MEYRQIVKSPNYRSLNKNCYSKELGRLSQGISDVVEETNTIYCIDKPDVLAKRWKDVMYGSGVVNYIPEKSNPYQTRLIVGGNLIVYPSGSSPYFVTFQYSDLPLDILGNGSSV